MKTHLEEYKLKTINKDFIVDEVYLKPSLTTVNAAKYTYLRIQKSGLTTFQAEEKIGVFCDVALKDINCQGLKDEDAVTSQILSIKKIIDQAAIEKFNKRNTSNNNSYVKIQNILGYGQQPVAERNLHGNCFEITLRGLDKKLSEGIYNYVSNNRYVSFINYYDKQRFGMAGGPYNTHLIGKAIINEDIGSALKEIAKTKNADDISNFSSLLHKRISLEGLISSVGPKKVPFFIESYNSLVWNQTVSAMLPNYSVCTKETFEGVGALHFPTENNYIVPQKVTSSAYQIDLVGMQISEKTKDRNLLVQTSAYFIRSGEDKIFPKKYFITLAFFLPTGCYATMFINQLVILAKKQK